MKKLYKMGVSNDKRCKILYLEYLLSKKFYIVVKYLIIFLIM